MCACDLAAYECARLQSHLTMVGAVCEISRLCFRSNRPPCRLESVLKGTGVNPAALPHQISAIPFENETPASDTSRDRCFFAKHADKRKLDATRRSFEPSRFSRVTELSCAAVTCHARGKYLAQNYNIFLSFKYIEI